MKEVERVAGYAFGTKSLSYPGLAKPDDFVPLRKPVTPHSPTAIYKLFY